MLSEINQLQNEKYCLILFVRDIKIVKLIKLDNRMVGARDWWEEELGVNNQGHIVSVI